MKPRFFYIFLAVGKLAEILLVPAAARLSIHAVNGLTVA